MKSLLCASLFVVSSAAMACPNLSGSWTVCKSASDPSWVVAGVALTNVKTSPLEINIQTQEPYSNETMIVDGMERKTSSPSPYGEAVKSYKAECVGESIIHHTRVTLGGQLFADIKTVMTLEGERLIQSMSGSVGSNKNFKDTMICE